METILSLAIIVSTINNSAISAMPRRNATVQIKESKPRQPSPELSVLEYFEGTWRCQQPAAPASPNGVFTWIVKKDLNGFWYLGNAEETKSPDDSEPINSREFLGYDAASEKLVRSVVVGNGNFLNLTASSWQDGKLIWSGKVIDNGKSILLREEIIQNSPERFTATYFIPDENGNWKPVVNETCDRLR